MRKITAKLSRGALANVLGAVGALCLDVAAWEWRPAAGLAALGATLILVGWAVDE